MSGPYPVPEWEDRDRSRRMPISERIASWLSALPGRPSGFRDAHEAMTPSTAHLHEWLEHAIERALQVLRSLDHYERRYRVLGFRYHSVPHAFRHSEPAVSTQIRMRLQQTFETDLPRSQQFFFRPWFRLRDHAVGAIAKSQDGLLKTDVHALQALHSQVEEVIDNAETRILDLSFQVRGIERLIEDVYDAGDFEQVDLLYRFSKEGSLCRRWCSTFLEVEDGVELGKDRHQCIEQIVEVYKNKGWATTRYTVWREMGWRLLPDKEQGKVKGSAKR